MSRSTLTSLSSRAIKLLTPIADAQFKHVLQSKVLAIDETPIKAGQKSKSKLNTGYFWPLYGDADEVSFRYCSSRSGKHLTQLLDGFSGTLLTDGYEAYARYANGKDDITHSQCWAHTRRYFEEAQAYDPARADEALQIIGALYQNEQVIRDQSTD